MGDRRSTLFVRRRTTAALLLACLCFAPAWAQYTTASLGGTVTDATGAVVPDATVTVRNVQTGFSQQATTTEAGAFLFPRLPVGEYELRVEKAGFSSYIQAGITLTVNEAATQSVTLSVGEVTQSVKVEANAELVQTRSATTGQLVDSARVVDLPLNGRMAQSLVYLAAGTIDLSDRYCGEDCHGGVYPGEQTAGVNGAGPGQVNYQLDGTGHNDTYLNMNLPFPNPDAIQEFNLQSSNFSAQYGNAGGGVVNIVTRSGTNEFHGSLFEFLRNGKLNARNFFAPRQDTLKRNQFGGSVGGPIARNKLFFFGTYQGTRIRSASEGQIAFVPTAAERQGDFSGLGKPIIDPQTGEPFPGNKIPSERFSQAALFFLDPKWVPLPNAGGRQLTYATAGVSQTENQFMGRVDYNLNEHQISGRYFFTDFDRPAVVPGENILTARGNGNAVRVQNVSVNHTWTMSPTSLLTSTFGWNRQRGGSSSSAPFSFTDAGVKIAATDPPELSIWGIADGFSVDTNHLGDFDRGDFTIREEFTLTKSAHELHFGGEAVRVSNHIINTFLQNGYFLFDGHFTGDGLADFLMGNASGFGQGGGEYKDLRGTKWSFYAQDNWRVSSRLTVNLGLRWDPYWPYYDREGRVSCFVPGAQSRRYPNAPPGLLYGGDDHDSGCPVGGSEPDVWNLSPRIGFAYRLTQDGKTSLRGGVGYYFTPPPANQFNPFTNIAPFAPGFFFSDVSFDDPFGSAGVPNPFPEQYGPRVPGPEVEFTLPTTIRAVFDPHFQLPVLATWNLNLERQFLETWVARIGYQGNKGTHLSSGAKPTREMNPAIYIPGQSDTGNTQERRPYKDFSNIGLWESSNNSHYNALQLNLEKRFGKGLSILTNYTWSKVVDDYGWSNPFNRRFDYGPSDDDVNHVFKFSNLWEIPGPKQPGPVSKILGGWAVNSVVIWRSGFPFSIASGQDNSLSGNFADRADFLGGKASLDPGRPHGELIQRYFDTSKFVPNAIGTFGNSGKNILRGPGLFNTDIGILKNTQVYETMSVQFRGEFFNAFNNVNFNGPVNNLSDSNIGRILSARSPRILQFGLKLLF
jgi:hypothetical protein